MDKRVEIHGTTRADMNGKRGVATDFHPVFNSRGGFTPAQSRYTVKLDSGESFKVKPASVRAERAGAGPSTAKAAKGKGKKGRRNGASK